MAVVEKKAPMILGIGAVLAGIFLLFRKKKPPNAVLEIAYAWWDALGYWIEIVETNTWPPHTAIITSWKVKNSGGESAIFKTRLLQDESAEAWLDPGETFFFEHSAISLSPGGTHQFTLQMLADDEVVAEYPFQVIT